MNKIILLFAVLFFQSCIDKNADSTTKIERPSVDSIAIESTSNKIPSIDFNELEPLLNKKNDSTYVVNFWATWCKPCVKELPAFEELNKKYASKKVKVILVSLDFPKQLESKVIPFVEEMKIESQVILLKDPDANNWIPKVDGFWTGAIPATLIYDSHERVFYERSFTYEELKNKLNLILKT